MELFNYSFDLPSKKSQGFTSSNKTGKLKFCSIVHFCLNTYLLCNLSFLIPLSIGGFVQLPKKRENKLIYPCLFSCSFNRESNPSSGFLVYGYLIVTNFSLESTPGHYYRIKQ
jgi:hypothetical protein